LQLHTREWGSGDKVAVLVHGMMGDSRQFWEVGPALADRGFRAIAVDLPGHGRSGQCFSGGLAAYAASVVESVPSAPALAVGHSMGASIVALALSALRPRRAVYVDVPFLRLDKKEAPEDEATLTDIFTRAKSGRTADHLAATRPGWKAGDYEVEEAAARRFDVPTAVALEMVDARGATTPPSTSIPSLLIRADPSDYVSDERARELTAMGFAVRGVKGAGHSVWYGFFSEYMELLDTWLAEPGLR
jgi:pimeloyl-ACP methyl ester carboxylesterase